MSEVCPSIRLCIMTSLASNYVALSNVFSAYPQSIFTPVLDASSLVRMRRSKLARKGKLGLKSAGKVGCATLRDSISDLRAIACLNLLWLPVDECIAVALPCSLIEGRYHESKIRCCLSDRLSVDLWLCYASRNQHNRPSESLC